ncbi:cation-translocating P-type ATPase [Shewanella sp. cp20]|uniref:cation-translocating P-type ATPase n=1 Tax=Shewanella sp. cp20 TaxID=1521167 RepID=UPI0005A17061|nr:HAD-IC family P-type ATPase [Shewanella sp. cp20]KIO36725.1 haloacid dehalogenase [Shewanella sp. cp20]
MAGPGLSSQVAAERLEQHGPNCLPKPARLSFVRLFILQFKSAFIYVLLAAFIACLLLGQFLNAIFIFAVLLLNAIIGTVQEYSAQQAADALSKMVPSQTKVIRDGHPKLVDSMSLVPGDYILLTNGDRIGADIKIEKHNQFKVDESALTGESLAVNKTDLAFAGTLVTHGRAEGEVVATGARTQIGQIAALVRQGGSAKPPLMQRIERFTLIIAIATLVIIALIFGLTLLRGADLSQVFLLGVALAVSAIPEGLPAAITVALAIGMKRMSQANVIVRKLVAVESLGSCTYIASDKTGTLTVNEMTISQISLLSGERYHVSGTGLSPTGLVHKHGHGVPVSAGRDPQLHRLALTGVLANEAHLIFEAEQGHGDQIHADGDGVDLAFLTLGYKLNLEMDKTKQPPQERLFAYESENQFSASINLIEGRSVISVKGAVEKLLTMCQLDEQQTQAVLDETHWLARHGYRVLALASGEVNDSLLEPDFLGLDFLGLVAMSDPLREDAIEAVALCQQAQIKVAMITGDHPVTALALARQLKLAKDSDAVITGEQLTNAQQQSVTDFDRLIASHRVFARVQPRQKMEITESLIRQGEFVAMTGDGVNDAPALKHAHVGIAMGRKGTDVARESADLVLTDDRFSSIVKGIIEGRIVYNNIRKVIYLLISTGAAELLLFILSVLFAQPIPLFPLQILWLNLVTNGVQDVALAFEPGEGHEIDQPPRKPSEPIFDRLMLERLIVSALWMGIMAFGLFSLVLAMGNSENDARNLTLMLMVLFENVHALNSRSERNSLLRMPMLSNPLLLFGIVLAQGIHIGASYTPGLSQALGISPIGLGQWLILLSAASTLLFIDEYHKRLWRQQHRPKVRQATADRQLE